MSGLEKVLEEIEAERADIDESSSAKDRMLDRHWNNCLDAVADIIKKHTNDGWIPVEDRLPEDDVNVLVTYADIDDEEYADITITTYGNAYFGGNKLDFKEWRIPFEYFRSNYKVIAWQPLPEPYQAERSDNNDGE